MIAQSANPERLVFGGGLMAGLLARLWGAAVLLAGFLCTVHADCKWSGGGAHFDLSKLVRTSGYCVQNRTVLPCTDSQALLAAMIGVSREPVP